ncbi:sel1-repeat-containing protein YbeT [Hydra vulgaris]|uniref:Sel1-repeat-containing protein YbeT n=1 Tax=Hydra vulgaris TaxID=6087 RepID=A0ABM4C413_HYDVU
MQNITKRYKPSWAPGEPGYNPLLPYGPKVYLARKKKPDPWWVFALEVFVVVGVLCMFVYMYYYIDHLHTHAARVYAHLGSSDAQHVLAHNYLHGRGGLEKDEEKAMYWFKMAADAGHPEAGYNAVASHMQGYNINLKEREIEQYLKNAHENGIEDATRALKDMLPHKY